MSFINKYKTSITYPLYENIRCFVLINKWSSSVQSALSTICLYTQSGYDPCVMISVERIFVKLNWCDIRYCKTFLFQRWHKINATCLNSIRRQFFNSTVELDSSNTRVGSIAVRLLSCNEEFVFKVSTHFIQLSAFLGNGHEPKFFCLRKSFYIVFMNKLLQNLYGDVPIA